MVYGGYGSRGYNARSTDPLSSITSDINAISSTRARNINQTIGNLDRTLNATSGSCIMNDNSGNTIRMLQEGREKLENTQRRRAEVNYRGAFTVSSDISEASHNRLSNANIVTNGNVSTARPPRGRRAAIAGTGAIDYDSSMSNAQINRLLNLGTHSSFSATNIPDIIKLPEVKNALFNHSGNSGENSLDQIKNHLETNGLFNIGLDEMSKDSISHSVFLSCKLRWAKQVYNSLYGGTPNTGPTIPGSPNFLNSTAFGNPNERKATGLTNNEVRRITNAINGVNRNINNTTLIRIETLSQNLEGKINDLQRLDTTDISQKENIGSSTVKPIPVPGYTLVEIEDNLPPHVRFRNRATGTSRTRDIEVNIGGTNVVVGNIATTGGGTLRLTMEDIGRLQSNPRYKDVDFSQFNGDTISIPLICKNPTQGVGANRTLQITLGKATLNIAREYGKIETDLDVPKHLSEIHDKQFLEAKREVLKAKLEEDTNYTNLRKFQQEYLLDQLTKASDASPVQIRNANPPHTRRMTLNTIKAGTHSFDYTTTQLNNDFRTAQINKKDISQAQLLSEVQKELGFSGGKVDFENAEIKNIYIKKHLSEQLDNLTTTTPGLSAIVSAFAGLANTIEYPGTKMERFDEFESELRSDFQEAYQENYNKALKQAFLDFLQNNSASFPVAGTHRRGRGYGTARRQTKTYYQYLIELGEEKGNKDIFIKDLYDRVIGHAQFDPNTGSIGFDYTTNTLPAGGRARITLPRDNYTYSENNARDHFKTHMTDSSSAENKDEFKNDCFNNLGDSEIQGILKGVFGGNSYLGDMSARGRGGAMKRNLTNYTNYLQNNTGYRPSQHFDTETGERRAFNDLLTKVRDRDNPGQLKEKKRKIYLADTTNVLRPMIIEKLKKEGPRGHIFRRMRHGIQAFGNAKTGREVNAERLRDNLAANNFEIFFHNGSQESQRILLEKTGIREEQRQEIIGEVNESVKGAFGWLRIKAAVGNNFTGLSERNTSLSSTDQTALRQTMLDYIRGRITRQEAENQVNRRTTSMSPTHGITGRQRNNVAAASTILREADKIRSTLDLMESKKNNKFKSPDEFAQALLTHKNEHGEYPEEIISIFGDPDQDREGFNEKFSDKEANSLFKNLNKKQATRLIKLRHLDFKEAFNLEKAGSSAVEKSHRLAMNTLRIRMNENSWKTMAGYSGVQTLVATMLGSFGLSGLPILAAATMLSARFGALKMSGLSRVQIQEIRNELEKVKKDDAYKTELLDKHGLNKQDMDSFIAETDDVVRSIKNIAHKSGNIDEDEAHSLQQDIGTALVGRHMSEQLGRSAFGGVSEKGFADLAIHSIAGAEKWLTRHDSLSDDERNDREIVPFVVSGRTHEDRVNSVLKNIFEHNRTEIGNQIERKQNKTATAVRGRERRKMRKGAVISGLFTAVFGGVATAISSSGADSALTDTVSQQTSNTVGGTAGSTVTTTTLIADPDMVSILGQSDADKWIAHLQDPATASNTLISESLKDSIGMNKMPQILEQFMNEGRTVNVPNTYTANEVLFDNLRARIDATGTEAAYLNTAGVYNGEDLANLLNKPVGSMSSVEKTAAGFAQAHHMPSPIKDSIIQLATDPSTITTVTPGTSGVTSTTANAVGQTLNQPMPGVSEYFAGVNGIENILGSKSATQEFMHRMMHTSGDTFDVLRTMGLEKHYDAIMTHISHSDLPKIYSYLPGLDGAGNATTDLTDLYNTLQISGNTAPGLAHISSPEELYNSVFTQRYEKGYTSFTDLAGNPITLTAQDQVVYQKIINESVNSISNSHNKEFAKMISNRHINTKPNVYTGLDIPSRVASAFIDDNTNLGVALNTGKPIKVAASHLFPHTSNTFDRPNIANQYGSATNTIVPVPGDNILLDATNKTTDKAQNPSRSNGIA